MNAREDGRESHKKASKRGERRAKHWGGNCCIVGGDDERRRRKKGDASLFDALARRLPAEEARSAATPPLSILTHAFSLEGRREPVME